VPDSLVDDFSSFLLLPLLGMRSGYRLHWGVARICRRLLLQAKENYSMTADFDISLVARATSPNCRQVLLENKVSALDYIYIRGACAHLWNIRIYV